MLSIKIQKNLIIFLLLIFTFFLFINIYLSLGYYSDDPWWFFAKRFFEYENFDLNMYIISSLDVHEGYHYNRYLIAIVKEFIMYFLEDVEFSFKFLNSLNFIIILLNIYLLYKVFLKLRINFFSALLGCLILMSYPIIGEIRFWPTSLTPYSPSLSFLFLYILNSSFDEERPRKDFLYLILSTIIFEQLFFSILSIIFLKYLINLKFKKGAIILIPNIFIFLFIKIVISNYGHSPNFDISNIISNFSKIIFIFITPEHYSHPINIKNYIQSNYLIASTIFLFIFGILLISVYIDNKERFEIESKISYFNIRLLLIIFFTYVPNLFWDISPRHNYIPLGIFSILIANIFNKIKFNLKSVTHLIIIIVISIKIFSFTLVTSNEGSDWVRSFELRQDLYNKVKNYADQNNLSEVNLVNLPSTYGKVPLFAYENLENYDYINFQKNNLKLIYIKPIDTNGYHFDLLKPYSYPKYYKIKNINELVFEDYNFSKSKGEIILKNINGVVN